MPQCRLLPPKPTVGESVRTRSPRTQILIQRCLAASVTKAESIKKSPSGRSVHHHHPLPLLEDCVHSSIVFVGAVFDLI